MAPERVLPDPLSGAEIKQAILDRIRRRLNQDGYLNDNLAYDHYTMTGFLHIECHSSGMVAKVEIKETISPIVSDDENIHLETADAEFNVSSEESPNEERVETGQPVPVLTKDQNGNPDIKKVSYARNKVKK